MKREFVVTTETGDVSYSTKTDGPETFRTFKAARARAEALAKLTPGEEFRIYELTAVAAAPVGKVETSRKHPIEHYR